LSGQDHCHSQIHLLLSKVGAHSQIQGQPRVHREILFPLPKKSIHYICHQVFKSVLGYQFNYLHATTATLIQYL
jgi:hypothetical protein